jgi:signal transduction histidine kinase
MDEPLIVRQVVQGVAVFRVAAWGWAAIVAVASVGLMRHPMWGFALIALAGAVTFAQLSPGRWRRLAAGVEPLVAMLLLAGDGWVYRAGRPQSLAGVWPLASLLALGARRGAVPAVGLGAVMGTARAIGAGVLSNGLPRSWPGSTVLSVLSSTVLFCLGGWAAAYVTARVRAAEDAAAFARARERVARDLHDGMLQTLAAVQRRSSDSALVRLARAQEADVRAYLYADADADERASSTEGTVRAAVQDVTSRFGMRIEIALVPPLPESLDADVADVVRGVVVESLANTAKHSGTDRATIYGEVVDRALVLSVHDQGRGFDPETTHQRGLARSVRERVEAIGGTLEIVSQPGEGTDVRVTLPLGSSL